MLVEMNNSFSANECVRADTKCLSGCFYYMSILSSAESGGSAAADPAGSAKSRVE